ncbi:MAG: hypothetical protein NC911_01335 [Candidatus Omnitrophica bacterium]|nr:hypothetical protein [Candidatus Omnitrophota bacterium]
MNKDTYDGSGTATKLPHKQVFRCPTRSLYHRIETYGPWLLPSYAPNRSIFGRVSTAGIVSGTVPIQRIRKPSKTLMLIDMRDGHTDIDYLGRTNPGYQYPAVDYRHQAGANIAFVDGHVTWMKSPLPGDYLDIAYQDARTSGNGVLWE